MKKILIVILFSRSLIFADSCSIDQEALDNYINDFTDMINYQAGTNISKEDVRKQFIEALRSTGLIENAEIKIDDVINGKMIEWYMQITEEMKKNPIDVATTVRENAIKQKLPVIDPGTGDDYRINVD